MSDALNGIDKAKAWIRSNKGRLPPLHIAAAVGRTDVMEELVNAGADINSTSQVLMCTPIGLAVLYGHTAAVKWLCERGAQRVIGFAECGTSFYSAISGGFVDTVKEMLDMGFNMYEYNQHQGGNALHEAAAEGQVEIIKILAERGMNVNSTAEYPSTGWTPLHFAARAGQLESIHILVELGAAIPGDESVIRVAVLFDQPDAVLLIHELGEAIIGLSSETRGGCLHFAAECGSIDAAMCLLKLGYVVNKIDDLGRCPIHIASEKGHVHMVRLLLEHGSEVNIVSTVPSPLHLAAAGGHHSVVDILYEFGADDKAVDSEGFSPYYRALEGGNVLAVKAFVERGADIRSVGTDIPLLVAAFVGSSEVVTYLVDCGVEIHTCDSFNTSALHFAALQGHVSLVKTLIKLGFDVSCTNKLGGTALHDAAISGNEETVSALIQACRDAGFSVSVKNLVSGPILVF